ncbi:MAG: HAD-IIIA family hydrolase, partial [Bdellovibrionales bacterium]|nr:HAD-IIIA family hydrolase [Bdellovibrionales bacterium]
LKVGYTSGVFDILHRGHVEYLEKARDLCDRLIVGVNSDESVRQLKGPLRPIQDEESRASVIAALRCVDHAFIFSEKTNRENILALQPSLYIKAGDYDRSKLTSASEVEKYGGSVQFVPFSDGFSSSSVVDRIVERYLPTLAHCEEAPLKNASPAVFLDRDGTLCRHVEYLHEPEKFELLPGVLRGLQQLRDAGFRLVVVTNQPGIGLGYFTKEEFFEVNKEMMRQLSAGGVLIDKIYFSPYSKSDGTDCRKPGTLLGERAITELNLKREESWMIGDATSDVEFAKNLRCRSCLLRTGHAGNDGLFKNSPDYVAKDFSDAVDHILQVKG